MELLNFLLLQVQQVQEVQEVLEVQLGSWGFHDQPTRVSLAMVLHLQLTTNFSVIEKKKIIVHSRMFFICVTFLSDGV